MGRGCDFDTTFLSFKQSLWLLISVLVKISNKFIQ